MIAGFIWIFFLAGAAINLVILARLDLSRLDFLDGILIGQGYYVMIPLFVFLVEGQSVLPELSLMYRPYDDLPTTALLILGMFLLPTIRMLFPRVRASSADTTDPRVFTTVILLFIVTGLVSFMLTGLAKGGHWQANLEGAFENPAFLPIKYASNVARNAVFAVLLYRVTTGRMTAQRAILFGAALAVLDLLTTFNRITAVYLLLTAMLLMKHRPLRMALVGGASLWALSTFSTMWPAFRGLATAQGYTLSSFAAAWETAQRAQSLRSMTTDAALNGVFESSNLVVLNWIVENYGTTTRPFLSYAMFARPITLLLPGGVWPDRPQNFGLTLGDGIANLPSLALNSTLYGESYANFGWFWPLGLGVFLLMWHAIFRSIAPNARGVQMIGAFAGIAMWRFDASFIGCSALLTAGIVFGLRLLRLSRPKPVRQLYLLPPPLWAAPEPILRKK
ncbi:hypothetical protein ABVV53_06735 [Novosphingobium sp. RD2P27]|uniref:Oligosaccharide repeat unit polymerase n=1 Tax=Novosphingobium kalidii TaxID=3230299 RepID=A0ABV2CZW2_9SPHN